MAKRIRVRLDASGVADLQAHVGDLSRKLADAIADDARRYVPVDTGRLKDSIRTEHVSDGHDRVWAGNVAADVDYHLYQEYGTSKMPAQPYMRPAAYQRRDLS